MVIVNLGNSASEIVKKFNQESRKLKIEMNLGGFAWLVDEKGVCVENGFCLIGNSAEVQRKEIKKLADCMSVIAIVI